MTVRWQPLIFFGSQNDFSCHFDNEPVKAIEQRLTTLDFNAAGFIHRMLNFIARPPRTRGPYQHRPIEVEGIVMIRDTAGPARSAT